MVKKQCKEWLLTGLFIRCGKLGLYIHRATQFFKQTVEADSTTSFLEPQNTTFYLAKANVNPNYYPKSLLTVLKSKVHHCIILKEVVKSKNSVNPGWEKSKQALLTIELPN